MGREGITYAQVLEFEVTTVLNEVAGDSRVVLVGCTVTDHRVVLIQVPYPRISRHCRVAFAETRRIEDLRCGVIRGEHIRIRLHEVHNVERKSAGENSRQVDTFPCERQRQTHLHLRPWVTDGLLALLRDTALTVIIKDEVAHTRVLFLPVDTHLLAIRIQRLTVRCVAVRVIGVIVAPIRQCQLVIFIDLGLVLEDA